jgi:hypothetical protein
VSIIFFVECPRTGSTDLDVLKLLAAFGDSGELKQDHHQRVAGSLLENPFKSIENQVTFSLLAGLLSGVHQN